MRSQTTLTRQWLLLNLLSKGSDGWTVQQLADDMGVCPKTIRRDLATFAKVGFPIDELQGPYGRKNYRLDSGWRKPELSFTFDEALALYIGRKFLQPLAGTMVWEAAERAFRKIRATLGRNALRYIETMGGAFHETSFGWSDYQDHAEILDTLLVGIEDRKVVWITYQSQQATEPVTYDIHPYRLTRHLGSLYVIGLKAEEAELRTWRVDRIEHAELDQVPFSIPEDLDLDAHFAGSFGIHDGSDKIGVRIRFQPNRARFVEEKRWHHSQRMIRQRDGSLIVEFDLSSTVEVKAWVLSFGADAEVLAPESLRASILGELNRMIDFYEVAQQQATAKRGLADTRHRRSNLAHEDRH